MAEIKELCIKVVNNLIEGNYKALEKEGALSWLSEDTIKEVLIEYGGPNINLTRLPEEAFFKNRFSPIKLNDNSAYVVDIDLWIDDEWSDLTLQLDVYIDEKDNITSYRIYDIHVM